MIKTEPPEAWMEFPTPCLRLVDREHAWLHSGSATSSKRPEVGYEDAILQLSFFNPSVLIYYHTLP